MITAREIGPQRYRASYGRYFEDFNIGDVYKHRPGRTLTDHDNIQFALMTMNRHPMHCDMAYAKKSEFGRLLISSPLSLAVVVGLTVNDVSAKAVANLGWNNIKLSRRFLPATPCTLKPKCWKSAVPNRAHIKASLQ